MLCSKKEYHLVIIGIMVKCVKIRHAPCNKVDEITSSNVFITHKLTCDLYYNCLFFYPDTKSRIKRLIVLFHMTMDSKYWLLFRCLFRYIV